MIINHAEAVWTKQRIDSGRKDQDSESISEDKFSIVQKGADNILYFYCDKKRYYKVSKYYEKTKIKSLKHIRQSSTLVKIVTVIQKP